MPPAEDTTETAVVVWLAPRHPRALRPLGLGGPRARRIARTAGTLLVTAILAFVPGTLLLAAAVLLWQRLGAHTHERRAAIHRAPPALAAVAARLALPRRAGGGHRVPEDPHRPPHPPEGTADLLAPAPPTPRPPKPPSCSAGDRTGGPLEHPAELPIRGPGFAQLFPHRHLDFATDGLVAAIERVARRVHTRGAPPLMVLNLSGPTGAQAGQDPFHPGAYSRGHGAGRAADLAFFVDDTTGQPVPAVESTLTFGAGGVSEAGTRRLYLDPDTPLPGGCVSGRIRAGLREVLCPVAEAAYHVDFERTWDLVAALLEDPGVGVVDPATGKARAEGHGRLRFLFVSAGIKRGILAAGRRAGAPPKLLALAGILLHVPTNAKAYDHYLHLDLWCTDHDRTACGCRDGGGPWRRWRAGTQVIPPPAPVAQAVPRDLHAPAGYLRPGP